MKRQTLTIGNLRVRFGWRNMASWGWPVVEYRGLAFLTRHSDGALDLVAYHPRSSTTWHWSVTITRRQRKLFTPESLGYRAELYRAGNPHAPRPRWWHRFVNRDALRANQWHDYYRLPLGYALTIARQSYHRERAA